LNRCGKLKCITTTASLLKWAISCRVPKSDSRCRPKDADTGPVQRLVSGRCFVMLLELKALKVQSSPVRKLSGISEQVLPIGGVCLLGSINLTQFVNKNSTGTGYDYEKLRNTIRIAVRFLDNVNDVTFVPLQEQRDSLVNKRRVGLGVLGYASSLMMMKIKYGSDRALELTHELMKMVRETAYTKSAELAKEKGPFKLFDTEKFLKSPSLEGLTKKTLDLIRKTGIRNSHLLSIQPTGNTSVCSNNVSGGLEPLFMPEYTRTSIFPHPPDGLGLPKNVDWTNKTFLESRPFVGWEWTSEGDENVLKTTEPFNGFYWKYDHQRGLLRETPVKDYSVRYLGPEWNPGAEWAATALKGLNVSDHISILGVFAQYVCSSSSKTINCPNDYPYNDFKKMYMDAFDTGYVKGLTSYRTGTMAFVLSETKKEGSGKPELGFPAKRPETVECDIDTFKGSDGANYIILTGLIDERPYEVFAFKQSKILISNKVKKGKLVKVAADGYDGDEESKGNPKTQYNLETDYVSIENLQSQFENDEQSALTRMISVALREGANINEIYHQLISCGGTVGCFASSIARTLSRHVTEVKETKCEECKDPDGLVFQEGCLICKNCAYSKCV